MLLTLHTKDLTRNHSFSCSDFIKNLYYSVYKYIQKHIILSVIHKFNFLLEYCSSAHLQNAILSRAQPMSRLVFEWERSCWHVILWTWPARCFIQRNNRSPYAQNTEELQVFALQWLQPYVPSQFFGISTNTYKNTSKHSCKMELKAKSIAAEENFETRWCSFIFCIFMTLHMHIFQIFLQNELTFCFLFPWPFWDALVCEFFNPFQLFLLCPSLPLIPSSLSEPVRHP